MRICYLSSASSYHTQKWCKYFYEKGHDVHLITFTDGESEWATVHKINAGMNGYLDSDCKKLSYLFHGRELKKIISEINPDIIHAHRIPSYGGACAVINVHPFVLSMWGGDIYDFPEKSILHKFLVKHVLKKADILMSTSNAMAHRAESYTKKEIYITPFGVDCRLFNSNKRERNDNSFVVGNIKSLEKKYGIEYMLKACALVRRLRPDIPLRVRIAGKGTQELDLKQLSRDIGIDDITEWLGFISQEKAAYEWANMDCAIISSESESFGVSAVEAQASGIPVIVTNIPGLMEATNPGITSIVVNRMNCEDIADKIIYLYDFPTEREKMGKEGRVFVESHYELSACFDIVERIYKNVIENRYRK